jgi:hypothetical protein
MRYDDAVPGDVTELYINDITNENGDAGTILGLLAAGNRIYVQQQDDASRATLFELTGPAVDNTGWWTLPVSVVSTLALPANNKTCAVIMNLGAGGGGGSNIVNLGVEDLTGVNTIDLEGWQTGDVVQGFRVDYWDVNMNGNAQDPTIRLYDSTGAAVAAGYNNFCCEMEQAAFNHIITAETTRARMDGASGLGLFHGFFEGRLVDDVLFKWTITGQFYDDFDDSVMFCFCDVDIGDVLHGLRLQTANVGSLTAGFLNTKYWT